jgi:acetylornithine deacetylase
VGVLWFRVRVLGRTTHVLEAGSGVNAIEKSWVVIRALRELERELNRPENIPPGYRDVPHPINLNVGAIDGGDWPSTVAGECVTRFRIGLFPGESCETLQERINRCVAEAAAGDAWLRTSPPSVEYVGFRAEGCECDIDGEFGRTLRNAHRGLHGRPPEELSATCTTDVRFFSLYHGTPATCYGPKARNIHGVDEKVSIDSMERVAGVLACFIGDWCGLRDA